MAQNKVDGVSLSTLKIGEAAVIEKLLGDKISRQRLIALGIVKGQAITLDTKAPMGDPRVYEVLGYRLLIRNEDAENIIVSPSPS